MKYPAVIIKPYWLGYIIAHPIYLAEEETGVAGRVRYLASIVPGDWAGAPAGGPPPPAPRPRPLKSEENAKPPCFPKSTSVLRTCRTEQVLDSAPPAPCLQPAPRRLVHKTCACDQSEQAGRRGWGERECGSGL